MEIYGSLSDFPLIDILTLCIETMITGALTVVAGDEPHTLYFDEGHLHHASGPDGTGYAAVWPLFELSDAPYHFYVGRRVNDESISDTTPAVLARAQTLARGWAEIRHLIAGPRAVPIMAAPPSDDHVQIDERDWPVLAGIDGQRSITDIARVTALEELGVCHSLLRLRERGLVEITPPPARAPMAEVAQPAMRTIGRDMTDFEQQGGFFTRVLSTLPLSTARQMDLSLFSDPVLAGMALDNDAILRLIRMS